MKYTLTLDGDTFHYVNKLLFWHSEGDAEGFTSPELVEALAAFHEAHNSLFRKEMK